MTQTLLTINNYASTIATYKTNKRPLTLIGYVDRPTPNLSIGDLIIYHGHKDSTYGFSLFLLENLKRFLVSKTIKVKRERNSLILFNNIVVMRYNEFIDTDYSFSEVQVYLPNALNDCGISGSEVYDLLLATIEDYSKLNVKKGEH